MEALIVDALKVLWQKSDPMLILCFVAYAWWQYRDSKAVKAEVARIAAVVASHLSSDVNINCYPHPQCKEGQQSYKALHEELKEQRKENREDHQEIFNLLRENRG